MSIGEVARRSSISASAIRYYESIGILPKPHRVSGRRIYGEAILPLLALVQYSKGVGFSVKQIRTLVAGVEPRGRFSTALQKLARSKIIQLDEMIVQATQMKALLEDALACRCLTATMCGSRILQGTINRMG